MIVKVSASSADIQADLTTLTFRLSRRALPSGQPVYITVDDGVAESTDGLTCKGYNFTDNPFTIPRTAYGMLTIAYKQPQGRYWVDVTKD